MNKNDLATYIDHTLLRQDASVEEIEKLCQEAKKHGFASVCINPYFVNVAYDFLRDAKKPVIICTVVGFPLGANDPEVKIFETNRAIANGATEIDMVINLGALKAGNDEFVLYDIKGVVQAAGPVPVKVIIETCLLNKDQKIKACELAIKAGAAFVKTSTGFSTAGATVEDVRLMKEVVGKKAQVKASGGIKDYETAIKMIEAGATRLGTSASVSLVS